MDPGTILAILSFLLKNYPAIIEVFEKIAVDVGLKPAPDPTDAEAVAKRFAEYASIGVWEWRGVWNLDFGHGEEGNVNARHQCVKKKIYEYAIDRKNEMLTDAELEAIVRTSLGLAAMVMHTQTFILAPRENA